MKHIKLLLVIGSVYLIHETRGSQSSQDLEELKPDLPQAGSEFKCPFIYGAFADPEDCAHFYICIAGRPWRNKCGFMQNFDMYKKRCLPFLIAVCGNKDKKTTTSVTVTESVTSEDDKFVCSSFMGSFPHPNDCSKYYSCLLYKPKLKTCPAKKLFDAVKKSCESEDKVHCGTKQRPGFSTTPVITTETETPTEVTETTIITTTEVFPTGPPEHDCDEDDVDCIVDETGDPAKWFKCPLDVASFPHPSSDKLFIFCMNWVPSVKRCGLDMVFSKETNTCVSTLGMEEKYMSRPSQTKDNPNITYQILVINNNTGNIKIP